MIYCARRKPKRPISSFLYRLYVISSTFIPRRLIWRIFIELEFAARRICLEISNALTSDDLNISLAAKRSFIVRNISGIDQLVDLGCAGGRDSRWLREVTGKPVLGIDHNPILIRKALKLASGDNGLTFRCCDISEYIGACGEAAVSSTGHLEKLLISLARARFRPVAAMLLTAWHQLTLVFFEVPYRHFKPCAGAY